MSRSKLLVLVLLSVLLQSCAGGAAMSVAGHRVGGFHPDGCDGYEQSNKNVEALVTYAEKLNAEGKISAEKLIEVDQEAGIYSQKLMSACRFFTAGDISFEQYQDAVERADQNYREIRKSLSDAERN